MLNHTEIRTLLTLELLNKKCVSNASFTHLYLTLFSMLLASSWVTPIKDSLLMAMSWSPGLRRPSCTKEWQALVTLSWRTTQVPYGIFFWWSNLFKSSGLTPSGLHVYMYKPFSRFLAPLYLDTVSWIHCLPLILLFSFLVTLDSEWEAKRMRLERGKQGKQREGEERHWYVQIEPLFRIVWVSCIMDHCMSTPSSLFLTVETRKCDSVLRLTLKDNFGLVRQRYYCCGLYLYLLTEKVFLLTKSHNPPF